MFFSWSFCFSAQLGRLNFPEIRHMQSKHQSLIEQRRVNHFDDNEQPPPLPVKKKHSKYIRSHFSIHSTNESYQRARYFCDFKIHKTQN